MERARVRVEAGVATTSLWGIDPVPRWRKEVRVEEAGRGQSLPGLTQLRIRQAVEVGLIQAGVFVLWAWGLL